MILAAVAANACGGDSGRIDLGLPRSKVLSEITDDEARTICESVQPEDVDIQLGREQDCTISGLFSSSTQAECESIRDACIASPPDTMDEPQDCSMAKAEQFMGCGATVGEVEGCMDAYLDTVERYLKSLTCADAGMVSPPAAPGVCAPVQERCPELLEALAF